MIRAVGYSKTPFDPLDPGRLCRGRERWVTSWEEEGVRELERLVVSGAAFSDDSARDAVRGLTCAELDCGLLLRALFPAGRMLVYREEAALAEVPPYVGEDGQYWASRRGGLGLEPAQRWMALVEDLAELNRVVLEDRVDLVAVLREGQEVTEEVAEALYLLTGMGDPSEFPVARFQPLALDGVLRFAEAVVLVHMDKHGPALGVYTREALEPDVAIRAVCDSCGCVAVPFSIPPMLARWDRALLELREKWEREAPEVPFPVPEAPWEDRRRRRRRPPTAEEPSVVWDDADDADDDDFGGYVEPSEPSEGQAGAEE